MAPSPRLSTAALSAWEAELARAFPNLSVPQARGLAQYSHGIVLSGSCGLSSVSFALSLQLSQPLDAVRERLRDGYCAAQDKSGQQRQEVCVESCFAPLLAWLLRDWDGEQLALALDATTLGQRFTVLAVSLLYRGDAIPVAWVVLPACTKGAWKPHWIDLLQRLKDIVPAHWRVIVAADRGLYARWLFRQIVSLGWHPLLRINTANAAFRPEGRSDFGPIAPLLSGPGQSYAAAGRMFQNAHTRLDCTLCARWSPGCEQGCFVLTDLPPQEVDGVWYTLRFWIERGFLHSKSGGWQWQDTRMLDVERAQRLWLAMALASVQVLRAGGQYEQQQEASRIAEGKKPPADGKKPRRILSTFRTGLLATQLALFSASPPPPARWVPEPWPTTATPCMAPATAPLAPAQPPPSPP